MEKMAKIILSNGTSFMWPGIETYNDKYNYRTGTRTIKEPKPCFRLYELPALLDAKDRELDKKLRSLRADTMDGDTFEIITYVQDGIKGPMPYERIRECRLSDRSAYYGCGELALLVPVERKEDTKLGLRFNPLTDYQDSDYDSITGMDKTIGSDKMVEEKISFLDAIKEVHRKVNGKYPTGYDLNSNIRRYIDATNLLHMMDVKKEDIEPRNILSTIYNMLVTGSCFECTISAIDNYIDKTGILGPKAVDRVISATDIGTGWLKGEEISKMKVEVHDGQSELHILLENGATVIVDDIGITTDMQKRAAKLKLKLKRAAKLIAEQKHEIEFLNEDNDMYRKANHSNIVEVQESRKDKEAHRELAEEYKKVKLQNDILLSALEGMGMKFEFIEVNNIDARHAAKNQFIYGGKL